MGKSTLKMLPLILLFFSFLASLPQSQFIPEVQASSVITKFPTSNVGVDGEWSNPENAYVDDEQYARTEQSGAGHAWFGYGFTFNATDIIEKVYVTVQREGELVRTLGGYTDFDVFLFMDTSEGWMSDEQFEDFGYGSIGSHISYVQLFSTSFSKDFTRVVQCYGNGTLLNSVTVGMMVLAEGLYSFYYEIDYISITVAYSTPYDPVARFTFSPSNPEPNELVSFNGAFSLDPDGSLASYQWSFGDGGNATGSTTTHTFTSTGTFSVNLTVTDIQSLTNGFVQAVWCAGGVSVGGGQNVGLNIAPNFDINILKMPSYVVTLPVWQRMFTMQTTVHNKGSFQQEVTLAYWLTVQGKSVKVWEGKQSFLLQSRETRPVDIEYPIPSEKGNYTAYAKVTYPSGSEGSLVQQSFTNYDVPTWFTSEGLIFLILGLAVPVVGFVAWATKEEKWSEWFE